MTRTDFNGDSTVTTYDVMGRVSRIDYGKDNTFEAFTYWPNGQMKTVTDINGGLTKYHYDNRDRLAYTTNPDGSRLDYQYDAVGNRTQVKVTRNGSVTSLTDYTYDSLNRMETVIDQNGTTVYTYDDAGNLDTVSYPNGLVTDYDYNTIHQLTTVTTRDSNNGDAVVSSFTYDLKPSGRRETITEATGRTTNYTYDGLYRLKTENITDATNGNYAAEYIYDFVGNRTYETVDGVQTAYQYDDNDRLLQQGGTQYTYDANGNLKTETLDGQTTTYSYNGKNNVTAVDKAGTTTAYGYNHNGIRTSKTENATTTRFIVDENRDYAQVLEEVENGTTEVQYSYGHDLLNQERNGSTSFYHYDGLGSTRALSDAAGTFTDRYNYEAFGELLNQTGSTENSYLFTGEQFDSESGNYYLRARYYDPGKGGFTSMDSWMGIDDNPLSLNKYIYTHADPTNSIDPSGKFQLMSQLQAQQIGAILNLVAIAIISSEANDFTSPQGGLRCMNRSLESTMGLNRAPVGRRDRECDESLNQMRLQLQQGSVHTWSTLRKAGSKKGVSVRDMQGALRQLLLERHSISWFPSALDSWLGRSIRTISRKLNTFPAGNGVRSIGTIRTLKEEAWIKDKEYRIEIENLRGHNLRSIH